jgi:hypothetical protein
MTQDAGSKVKTAFAPLYTANFIDAPVSAELTLDAGVCACWCVVCARAHVVRVCVSHADALTVCTHAQVGT